MFESWKRRRDTSRRREFELAAVLGPCGGECFANAVRDKARTEVALFAGRLGR
jgi:hypothetical protein